MVLKISDFVLQQSQQAYATKANPTTQIPG